MVSSHAEAIILTMVRILCRPRNELTRRRRRPVHFKKRVPKNSTGNSWGTVSRKCNKIPVFPNQKMPRTTSARCRRTYGVSASVCLHSMATKIPPRRCVACPSAFIENRVRLLGGELRREPIKSFLKFLRGLIPKLRFGKSQIPAIMLKKPLTPSSMAKPRIPPA